MFSLFILCTHTIVFTMLLILATMHSAGVMLAALAGLTLNIVNPFDLLITHGV